MSNRWGNDLGRWQGYLTLPAARGDVAEVERRLAEVPRALEPAVRAHARTVWSLAHWQAGGNRKRTKKDA